MTTISRQDQEAAMRSAVGTASGASRPAPVRRRAVEPVRCGRPPLGGPLTPPGLIGPSRSCAPGSGLPSGGRPPPPPPGGRTLAGGPGARLDLLVVHEDRAVVVALGPGVRIVLGRGSDALTRPC